MTPVEAFVAITLWTAAGVFVAVIIARIVRACLATEDPENPSEY
jgi:hypothetical protein